MKPHFALCALIAVPATAETIHETYMSRLNDSIASLQVEVEEMEDRIDRCRTAKIRRMRGSAAALVRGRYYFASKESRASFIKYSQSQLEKASDKLAQLQQVHQRVTKVHHHYKAIAEHYGFQWVGVLSDKPNPGEAGFLTAPPSLVEGGPKTRTFELEQVMDKDNIVITADGLAPYTKDRYWVRSTDHGFTDDVGNRFLQIPVAILQPRSYTTLEGTTAIIPQVAVMPSRLPESENSAQQYVVDRSSL